MLLVDKGSSRCFGCKKLSNILKIYIMCHSYLYKIIEFQKYSCKINLHFNSISRNILTHSQFESLPEFYEILYHLWRCMHFSKLLSLFLLIEKGRRNVGYIPSATEWVTLEVLPLDSRISKFYVRIANRNFPSRCFSFFLCITLHSKEVNLNLIWKITFV